MVIITATVAGPAPEGVQRPFEQATLDEFSNLAGFNAIFYYNKENKLTVDFPTRDDAADFVNLMNLFVFPYERGYMLGVEGETSVTYMERLFRFPEPLRWMVVYISRAEVWYDDQRQVWDCVPELKRVGQWDPYGDREHFLDSWWNRLVMQMDVARSTELGPEKQEYLQSLRYAEVPKCTHIDESGNCTQCECKPSVSTYECDY